MEYRRKIKQFSSFKYLTFPFSDENLNIDNHFLEDNLWQIFCNDLSNEKNKDIELLIPNILPDDTIIKGIEFEKEIIPFSEEQEAYVFLGKIYNKQCIIKIYNLEYLKQSIYKSKRKLTKFSNTDKNAFRCSPFWIECIGISLLNSEFLYGTLLFKEVNTKEWMLSIFMKKFTNTFSNLLLERNNTLPHNYSLAWLFQLIFYTIPFMKTKGILSHNDFKLDNIGYLEEKGYIHISITTKENKIIDLYLPSYDIVFYPFDFGWSAIKYKDISLSSTHSSICLEKPMNSWNPCTDIYQLCLSWLDHIRISKLYLDPTMKYVFNQILKNKKKHIFNFKNWDEMFYLETSQYGDFKNINKVLEIAKLHFSNKKENIIKRITYHMNLISLF